MSDKRPFWTGMSGAFAGLAGLIGAIAALVGILVQLGVIGGNGGGSTTSSHQDNPSWAVQANAICARANDSIQALPNPQSLDLTTTGLKALAAYGLAAVRINQRMVRDLGALEPPQGQEAEVKQFVRVAAQSNEAAEELLADVRVGNVADLQKRQPELSRLGQRFDKAAVDLGATTCAEGASFTGGLPSG